MEINLSRKENADTHGCRDSTCSSRLTPQTHNAADVSRKLCKVLQKCFFAMLQFTDARHTDQDTQFHKRPNRGFNTCTTQVHNPHFSMTLHTSHPRRATMQRYFRHDNRRSDLHLTSIECFHRKRCSGPKPPEPRYTSLPETYYFRPFLELLGNVRNNFFCISTCTSRQAFEACDSKLAMYQKHRDLPQCST